MKRALAVAAILLTSTALSAQVIEHGSVGTTVADLMTRYRLHRDQQRAAGVGKVKPSVVSLDLENDSFIIPAVGSLAGSNGTFFKSDVSIANRRSVPQVVAVGFLARGVNNETSPTLLFTIPANGLLSDNDFVANKLGKSGLGTLLVVALTSASATAPIDELAEIDGFSRIWTPQPLQPGATTSIGTVSQAFESFDIQDTLLTSHAYGLKQDENFRSNIGLVNLNNTGMSFTVNVIGSRGSTSFPVTVLPFSMEQPSVPAGIYGDFYIRVVPTNSNFYSSYGTTVDNRTGDGWVSHVH